MDTTLSGPICTHTHYTPLLQGHAFLRSKWPMLAMMAHRHPKMPTITAANDNDSTCKSQTAAADDTGHCNSSQTRPQTSTNADDSDQRWLIGTEGMLPITRFIKMAWPMLLKTNVISTNTNQAARRPTPFLPRLIKLWHDCSSQSYSRWCPFMFLTTGTGSSQFRCGDSTGPPGFSPTHFFLGTSPRVPKSWSPHTSLTWFVHNHNFRSPFSWPVLFKPTPGFPQLSLQQFLLGGFHHGYTLMSNKTGPSSIMTPLPLFFPPSIPLQRFILVRVFLWLLLDSWLIWLIIPSFAFGPNSPEHSPAEVYLG